MKCLFLLIPLILLTACTQSAKEPYVPTVNCEYDKFNNMKTCVLSLRDTTAVESDTENHFNLKSVCLGNECSDEYSIALQGYIYSRDAIYADYVIDVEGDIFKVVHNDFDVSCFSWGCFTKEYITIILDSDYTTQHATKGIEMKVYGTNGTSIIYVSSQDLAIFNNFLSNGVEHD